MFLSSTTSISKNIFLAIFAVVAFAIPSSLIYAAQVQIDPTTGTYNLGQTFTVSVQVAPTGNSANAVEANLKFDPSILSVVSISKDHSELSRWTTEPTFSNSLGTIQFAGVSLLPFTAPSDLLSVTFRALAPGSGGLEISKAAVFATDGLRTDVFAGGVPATFTVSSAQVPDTSVASDDAGVEEVLDIPMVWSLEFTDFETWYNHTSGKFTWDLPAGVEAVAVEIATSSSNRPNNNPQAIYETPIDEFSITAEMVSEGVQYLSLRFRYEDGWGEVLNRKLLIDTSAPESFSVEINYDTTSSFPSLLFEAVDFTSGIAYYEVAINGDVVDIISPEEAKFGYLLSRLEDAVYEVSVTAYDRAGNVRTTTTDVEVTAGWTASPSEISSNTLGSFALTSNISISILALIIVLLLIYVYFERKQMMFKEAKLMKETYEIQEQMEKIFSALRDEIYDQINTISKRKRLSKAEKEAVEGLSQAIEVSETLIKKEIDDVKGVLK
ncbi:MAG: cohesin domain-containing protein [Candidatus Paceibacteria bacterium]